MKRPRNKTMVANKNPFTPEVAVQKYADFQSLLKNLFDSSGNPIYVWESIGLWILTRSYDPTRDKMPEWCVDYLFRSAGKIISLAYDRAKDHKLIFDGELDDRPVRKRSNSDAHEIQKCLGFSRQGWSAIEDYNSTQSKFDDELLYEILRSNGILVKEAMDRTLEFAGISDERQLRRRFADVRKARAGGKTSPQRSARAKLAPK